MTFILINLSVGSEMLVNGATVFGSLCFLFMESINFIYIKMIYWYINSIRRNHCKIQNGTMCGKVKTHFYEARKQSMRHVLTYGWTTKMHFVRFFFISNGKRYNCVFKNIFPIQCLLLSYMFLSKVYLCEMTKVNYYPNYFMSITYD